MTPQDHLLHLLDHAPKGATAASLAVQIYGSATESNKRRVRALASELSPKVLSAPDVGYLCSVWATPDDYDRVANSLTAQAHKMLERARAVREAGRQVNSPQLTLAIG